MRTATIAIAITIFCVFKSYSQIVINEIFATNNSVLFEKTTFNFACYIELYNKGSKAVDIGGFYLSNNPSIPGMFRLPWSIKLQPNEFYVVFTDELGKTNHANFQLDADGGKLIFSNRDYQLLDSFTYGKQFPDLPYGQKPDGSGKWIRLAMPTPACSNNEVYSNDKICTKPTISPKAGFYSGQVNVTITANLVNAKVHYTTDGSEPNEKSPLYTGSFSISKNTIVKAKNFHSDYLPGSVSGSTYLINQRRPDLPVISVSVNPEYLNDDSIGIYVLGVNGVKNSCKTVANWNQDWERPAVFEYFDKNGNLQVSQAIDLKIAGGCTREYPLKSLGLKPSSRYGSGNFDYPFFASKPFKKGYGSLMLRNSGNDFNLTMFKDALLQELCIGQMDVDYQAYQPVAVYLNGEYQSLMNLREKIDKNYLRINQSAPIDSTIMLERDMVVINGSKDSYKSFFDSLNVVDIKTEAGFNFLERNIDINEFLNYLVVEIFILNKDWPGNNYKFWKSTKPGSKWRWIFTDLDFGFGLRHSALDSTLNYVTETKGPFWPNPPWSTLLIRKVFENPVTRDMFIQKMEAVISTVFNNDRVNAKIDSIKSLIATEMPFHWQKYGGNEADWNKKINEMRDFNKDRREYMSWHLKEFFKLYDSYTEVSFKSIDPAKASYFLNQILVSDSLQKEYSSDVPVEIEAIPSPGYDFGSWNIKNYKVEKVELLPKGSNWKYFDLGTDKIPETWKEAGYNDISWKEGYAEFGYGNNDEATVVDFGTNPDGKIITTAFRKVFQITSLEGMVKLKGKILFDDGAIVYLNGKEIYRIGMPSGPVIFSTLATRDKNDDNYFHTFEIPSGIVKIGENTLAVEIHQVQAKSNDISFDFSLIYEKRIYSGTSTSASAKLSGKFSESMELSAFYINTQAIQGLFFNEVSASNKVYPDNRGEYEDWLEIYNGGTSVIDLSRIFIEYRGKKSITWKLYNQRSFTLNPGSFLVYWADNETDEGPLHLPFKIPAEGEVIKLIQPVGIGIHLLDSIRIVAKNPGVTLGRFPDGKSDWVRMSIFSPGSVNIYQSTPIISIIEGSKATVFPNPATGYFIVKLENSDINEYRVDLIGNDGRVIKTVNSFKNFDKFNVADIREGAYILKITCGEEQILRKLIIIK